MRYLVIIVGIVIATCVTGCERLQPRQTPEATSEPAVSSDRDVSLHTSTPEEVSVPEEVQVPTILLNDGAGILNPGFENWVEGAPLHWTVLARREGRVAASEENRFSGDRALATGPGYTYNNVRQTVTADASLAGHTITFSVYANASEPETAKLMLQLDEKTVVYSANHSGSEEWEELSVAIEVPEDFEGQEFVVAIMHGGEPQHTCYYDDAAVSIE